LLLLCCRTCDHADPEEAPEPVVVLVVALAFLIALSSDDDGDDGDGDDGDGDDASTGRCLIDCEVSSPACRNTVESMSLRKNAAYVSQRASLRIWRSVGKGRQSASRASPSRKSKKVMHWHAGRISSSSLRSGVQ
jgi:hypothetical protein